MAPLKRNPHAIACSLRVSPLLRAKFSIRVIVIARKINPFLYKNTAPIMACIFRGIAHEKRGFRSLSLRGRSVGAS